MNKEVKEALDTLINYIPNFQKGILDLLYYSNIIGEEGVMYSVVGRLIEGLEYIYQVLTLTGLKRYTGNLESIFNLLQHGLDMKDHIYICDLFEYEVSHLLDKILVNIEEIIL